MTNPAERRQEPRHPVHAAVRVFLDSDQTAMLAEIVDLSGGGMRLQAPGLRLPRDARMQIRIARSDGAAATAVARVLRSHLNGIAFCFDTVCVSDRELLATPGFWSGAEAVDMAPIIDPTRG